MRAINSPPGQHPKTPRVFGVAERRIQAAADFIHSLLAPEYGSILSGKRIGTAVKPHGSRRSFHGRAGTAEVIFS